MQLKVYSDLGCWNLVQAVLRHAFEQAWEKNYAWDIREWALEKPNRFIMAFSEIGEHDYDTVVGRLAGICERTLDR